MTEKLTELTTAGIPYIVISDFDANRLEVYTLQEAKKAGIRFSIEHSYTPQKHSLKLTKSPVCFEEYEKKFSRVIEEIRKGNTYLLNLTQPTRISLNCSLEEIFTYANAPYKLLYKDEFVCFSPETFVQIQNDTIATFPMKGTIDASLPDAKERILADTKEMAEHIMVVDLLRNDLGIIAEHIRVERFRYITQIDSGEKRLLQVSSKITAKLPKQWRRNFAEILTQMLPAGSISGTPKKKTVELIHAIEGYERGFFSGVFGYFDGQNFDSCVMIRFIQKQNEGYIYKSGGGITLESEALAEYNELLDKVYIP